MTEVQELVARLRLKDEMSGPIRKVRAGISGVSDALNSPRMRQGISQIGTGIRNAAKIGAVGIGILASQVAVGLQSLIELEQQEAQTAAVIKSTGGAAGITAVQVGKLADKYESLNAVIGDEVIREAENMLLTFTNVRKDAFEPALEAILNLNTAMGKGPEGLTNTAILVGKALNDPERGLTALRRVGVSFSKDQEKVIKALIETGDLLGAQKIIIGELDKEFGGSFLAQGNTTAGKVAKFKDAIDDLQRSLATALLPAIGKVADRLSKFLQDPAVVAGISDLGDSIGAMFNDENLDEAGRIFGEVFQAAKDAAPTIAASARITADVVKAAVSMFRSLPPEIQKLAIGAFAINKLTGGLVTNLAGGLISGVLKQLVTGVVNVRGATVVVTGAAGGVGGAVGGAGKSKLGTAVGVISKVFIAGAAIGVFAELKGALDELSASNRAQAAGIATQTQKFTEGASLADLKSSLAGVDSQIAGLMDSWWQPEDLAYQLNIDGVKDAVDGSRSALVAAIARLEGKNASRLTIVSAAVNAAKTATNAVKAAVNNAANVTKTGTRSTTSAIERKKWRFQVNNTNINNVKVSVRETIKSTTTSKKLGNVYVL